ncbi:GLPGLI family protein [Tenacibaculum xiamenense]|uniref:GLPGLI family protein n=1 Tax=Tenacibaculum xiamenense TaxID=1261553 RepID=UPI003894385F
MKSLVLVFICWFISFNLFSQESFESGEVIYSVKIASKSNFENPLKRNDFNGFRKKMDRFSETVSYRLKFNRVSSLFSVNLDMTLEKEESFSKLAKVLTKSDHVYFVDFRKKTLIEQKPFFGEDFLVQSSTSDLKWELINETKVIGSYTCYKAKVKRKRSGPYKGEDAYITYIAWYCPTIPFNYGPFEFCNLPGLIIELSIKNRIYRATKVVLKKEEMKIQKPSKGKLVTKEELESIGKKAFENR